MTEYLLSLVPLYGLWMIGITTFLSCLAMPVPASFLMLTAGGFAAGGDLILWQTGTVALAGAVAGDQVGFGIGRRGGTALISRLFGTPKRKKLIADAENMLAKMGGVSIFLTRWLFSPLGPYMNIASGALHMKWPTFFASGVMGEVIWVTVYVGLGFLFADSISDLATMMGNASGFIAGLAVTIGLGVWIVKRSKKNQEQI